MTELKSRKRQRPNENEPPAWFIHPPTSMQFRQGEAVLFRSERTKGHSYRRGKILDVHSKQISIEEESSKEKVAIAMADQHGLLLPDLRAGSETTILVTPETKDFRHFVGFITSNDRILEIGCSSGESSTLMVSVCQSWVGFDTSKEMLEKCKVALQSISSQATKDYHPVIMNALVDPKKAREEACRFGLPTVVACDIGGNRELVSVLRMVSWALEELQPRFIMIKSRELTDALQSSLATINAGTGLVDQGHAWFEAHQQKQAMPKHPKKAPLVMSPGDPNTPICRYHNYHKNGCQKSDCLLDHEHCHFCLSKGHVGRECPRLSLPLGKTGSSSSRRRVDEEDAL